MSKSKGTRYSEEQILRILREVESGRGVAEVGRQYEESEATLNRWRSKYGGMDMSQLQRLRELEVENARLKKIVAQQLLDNDALKDLLGKKW
jgi:putative transposase